MTALDPATQKLALRRDPLTEITGLQVEPATGRIFGLVDGRLHKWFDDGVYTRLGPDKLDIIPLQQPKRKPLRCFGFLRTGEWPPQFYGAEEEAPTRAGNTMASIIPMIEIPPGHAMYETARVASLLSALRLIESGKVIGTLQARDALAAWEAGE